MTARILSLIILLLEIRGLSLSFPKRKWKTLVFYTQLSNLITAASAALLLVFGQPYWITVLRYISTCMLVMTFFVTTCVLIPMGGNPLHLEKITYLNWHDVEDLRLAKEQKGYLPDNVSNRERFD